MFTCFSGKENSKKKRRLREATEFEGRRRRKESDALGT